MPIACRYLFPAFLVLSACSSESSEDGGPSSGGSPSGGSSTGGSATGGSAAGGSATGGSGGSAAGQAGSTTAGGSGGRGGSGGGSVTCNDGEVRCRGACFTTVGQMKNGCELVARVGGSIDALATDGAALFSVDYTAGTYTVVRRDVPGYGESVLATNRVSGKIEVAGDFVYMNGAYENGTTNDTGLLRVSKTGSSDIELVHDPVPNSGDSVSFVVIDDMLYFFGMYVGGLRRVPVTGGSEELVAEGSVTSLTADATDFFYHVSGLDFQIRKAPRTNSMMYTTLGGSVTSANLYLRPSDPANLYWYFGELSRVSKSGGDPEELFDPSFGGLLVRIGPEHLLLSAPAVQPGLYAVTLDGATTTVVDDSDGDTSGFVETDSAYFFARDNALFRVAK